jgi:hypothetical protein
MSSLPQPQRRHSQNPPSYDISPNSIYGNHITRRKILTMPSTSRRRNRARKDRISINIVPEQSLDTGTISSCSHWLVGEPGESCCASRIVDDDSSETIYHDRRLTKVESLIISEVADWWQSQQLDGFWAPRNRQHRKVIQLAALLIDLSDCFRCPQLRTRSCCKSNLSTTAR